MTQNITKMHTFAYFLSWSQNRFEIFERSHVGTLNKSFTMDKETLNTKALLVKGIK